MDLFYSSISLVKKLIFSETLHDQPFFSIPQKGTVNKILNDWSQDLSLGLCSLEHRSFCGGESYFLACE